MIHRPHFAGDEVREDGLVAQREDVARDRLILSRVERPTQPAESGTTGSRGC